MSDAHNMATTCSSAELHMSDPDEGTQAEPSLRVPETSLSDERRAFFFFFDRFFIVMKES